MEVSQKLLIPFPLTVFCNLIVIDDGILLYKHYLKRATAIYDPIMRIFQNMEVSLHLLLHIS
jgi:hypothetical protein